MYVIGLTGNIGTGKSTVGAQLKELGAFVVDADLVYRDLIQPNRDAWHAVVRLFGEKILRPDRAIDRAVLGSIVFNDSRALRDLELATHPLVIARAQAILQAANPPIAVYEAIKLFESGSSAFCDEVWVVTAPRETQIQRLVASRGLTRDDAIARVDSQPSQDEKIALASVVLINAGDLSQLIEAVQREWKRVDSIVHQQTETGR